MRRRSLCWMHCYPADVLSKPDKPNKIYLHCRVFLTENLAFSISLVMVCSVAVGAARHYCSKDCQRYNYKRCCWREEGQRGPPGCGYHNDVFDVDNMNATALQ